MIYEYDYENKNLIFEPFVNIYPEIPDYIVYSTDGNFLVIASDEGKIYFKKENQEFQNNNIVLIS